MGLFKQAVVFVLVVSIGVFVAFFGRLPIFRRTPIGFSHRLIWIYVPNGFIRLDRLLTGGRLESSFNRSSDYLLYGRHSIVLVCVPMFIELFIAGLCAVFYIQIFFLLLLVVGELLFLPSTLPLLLATFPHSKWLRDLHYLILPTVIAPPYWFLYLCRRVESGISPSNHSAAMACYPFDHTIFQPSPTYLNPACRTCHLPKPARSKHCSICGTCVQKADHHCVWINNCVGRNNYIYFLSLLLSVSVLLAYGAYLGYIVLDTQIQHLQSAQLQADQPHWSSNLSWKAYGIRFGSILPDHPLVAAPALLSFSCFPLALGLFAYHVYLIWAGMTTNESSKWAELQEDIIEGRVWRAKIEQLTGDNRLGLVVSDDSQDTWQRDGSRRMPKPGPPQSNWAVSPEWCVVRMEHPDRRPRIKRHESNQDRRSKTNRTTSETSRDTTPSTENPELESEWVDDFRWQQVHSIRDVENIYDQGFWLNLVDWVSNRE